MKWRRVDSEGGWHNQWHYESADGLIRIKRTHGTVPEYCYVRGGGGRWKNVKHTSWLVFFKGASTAEYNDTFGTYRSAKEHGLEIIKRFNGVP